MTRTLAAEVQKPKLVSRGEKPLPSGGGSSQPGRSGDMAVVAEFDSIDEVKTYLSHPVHLDYIKDNLAGIVETRISVQFEI